MKEKILNLSKSKKLILALILLIVTLIIILLMVSNAFLKPVTNGDAITNVNLSTCGYFQLLNEEDSINLTNSYPMSDNKGMNTEPYSFDVKNTCDSDSAFKIYLVVTNDSVINDANIKVGVNDEIYSLSELETEELDDTKLNQFNTNIVSEIKQVYVIDKQNISAKESKHYDVRIWISSSAGNEVEGQAFNGVIAITDTPIISNTLADVILKNNGGIDAIEAKGLPDFTEVATTNEGMYALEDDHGMSYYFRGAVDNNWVKFIFGSENELVFYFRIVRINGNKSIRLIYSGESSPTEDEAVNNQNETLMVYPENDISPVYSEEYDDNMYVDYANSSIPEYLSSWLAFYLDESNDFTGVYNENNDYLDDEAGFCNDKQPSSVETSIDGIGGTGTTVTYYAPRIRFNDEAGINKPTFKCTNPSDYYHYVMAIITYDELIAAGAAHGGTNTAFYLYDTAGMWTMSPNRFNGTYAFMFNLYEDGLCTGSSVNMEYGIRPVFNFKNVEYESGSGAWNDPYTITFNGGTE